MVAPRVKTQLTRSLVRVPNSGRDRGAVAILHDLSRVSSAAALVPITSYHALGRLPSGISPRPPSSLSTMDQSLKKLSSGVVPPAGPRAAAGNGPLQVRAATNGIWYGPTAEAAGTSDGYRSGTLRNVTTSASTPVNPTSGRKRSLPVMQDGTLTTPERIMSPKVSRATAMQPTQRRPAPRRRAEAVLTMEHLLRQRAELRAENLALKQQLMRQFQQFPSGTVAVGL